VSRQDRKKRQKKLKGVSREVDARGLDAEPNLIHIAAATHKLLGILGNKNLPSRSSAATKYLYGLYEKSLHRAPGSENLVCEKGCSYCCHLFVSASAPQVFSIANYIRKNCTDVDAEIERICAVEKTMRGFDPEERLAGHHPCVLLVDGQCVAYPVRPVICRMCCSLSLAACEKFWDGKADVGDVPMPDYVVPLRKNYDQALWAALHNYDLPPYGYDLNHALLAALENPNAEEEWFQGADVFKGVARDKSEIENPFPSEIEKLFWEVILSLSRGETPPPNPFGA
jgi:hypothetical protein